MSIYFGKLILNTYCSNKLIEYHNCNLRKGIYIYRKKYIEVEKGKRKKEVEKGKRKEKREKKKYKVTKKCTDRVSFIVKEIQVYKQCVLFSRFLAI